MPTESVLVRSATPHDLLGLLRLKPDPSLHHDRFERQDQGQITYLIAHDAHLSVLGTVIIKWRGDAQHDGYPILEDLIVRTDLYGHGVGTRLLVQAEVLSAQRNCAWIGLNVQPVNNPRARSLYERLGYCDSGEPPHYDVYSRLDEHGERQLYEDCSIHMVKALSPHDRG